MGAFWGSWALWEKMCFVLGVSIIGVMCLGGLKLLYNHWRLRKYIAVASTQKAQQKEMRHKKSLNRRKGREVPFGVRAIESGIEVDGVWISRSNTPGPGSPALSESRDASPSDSDPPRDRLSNIPRIEMPQPAHGTLGVSPSRSSASLRPLSSVGATSAERVSTRLSSTLPVSTAQGRQTYQPRRSSHLRYSDSQGPGNSDALATLEGRQPASDLQGNGSAGRDPDQENRRYSPSWSGSSSSEGHDVPQASKARAHPDQAKATYCQNSSADERRGMDSLSSYRNSHAAEIGQPVSRNRTGGASADWTTTLQPTEHTHTFAGSLSPLNERHDPFQSPATTPVADHSQEAPSFQSFVNHTPGTRFETMDDAETFHAQDNALAIGIANSATQSRHSQIMRKVNSGFEILRPGTLDKPRQSGEVTEWNQDLEAGNKRHSKRLQRKRRDSDQGRESHFIEEV